MKLPSPTKLMRAPSGRLFETYSAHERQILLKLGWDHDDVPDEVAEGGE